MKSKMGHVDSLSIIIILIGVAIIMLSGFYSAKSKLPFKNTVYSEAIVTKIVDNDIYVKYEVAGLIRQKKVSSSNTRLSENQTIRIYYNKKKPDEVYVDNSTNVSHKLSKIGTSILAIGLVLLIIRIRRKKYQKDLKVSGKRIATTIKELKVNKNIVRNGKNPYIIVCSWINPEDNKEYTFNSPKIWGNPGELISIKNITTLIVYVDKKDYTKYIMDVEPLK